jgi:hypothetical protein
VGKLFCPPFPKRIMAGKKACPPYKKPPSTNLRRFFVARFQKA